MQEKRAKALEIIDNAAAKQASRWKEMHDTIELAADNVTSTRLSILEDTKAEESYPLIMSVIVYLVVGFIPISAIASIGLTKLIAFTRHTLGRVKLDKTARLIVDNVRAINKDLGLNTLKDQALSRRFSRYLLENDKITIKIVEANKEPVSKGLEKLFRDAGVASVSPSFKKTKINQSRITKRSSTDASLVVIKRALYDWIIATQLAEDLALNEIKRYVRETKESEIFLQEIDWLISSYMITSEVSEYSGPDVRVIFQQFIEKCIWCTTYNFKPTWKFFPAEYTYELDPPDFREKFWNRLTEHFIEIKAKGYRTYQEREILKTEDFPPKIQKPEARLANDFHKLRKVLTTKNIETAEKLLKAFKNQ